MDTIAKDLEELKVRFDTAPKLYEKKDFQKLLHVIEHLSEGGIEKPDEPEKPEEPEEPAPAPIPEVKDHKQYKGDTSRAIAKIKKRKKIKFTEDGFAIADKAIGQNATFHLNEKIYLNTNNNNKKITVRSKKILLDSILDTTALYQHIILIYRVKNTDSFQVVDYGKYSRIFTYRRNTRYIDGIREKKVIEKKVPTLTLSQLNVLAHDEPEQDCLNELQNIFEKLNLVQKHDRDRLNYGVRIYTKHTQSAGVSRKRSRSPIFNRKKMKFYRYGFKESGYSSIWNRGDGSDLFVKLYNYLLVRKLPTKYKKYSYLDAIIDHYQFHKGFTYRYKFRVYINYPYIVLR